MLSLGAVPARTATAAPVPSHEAPAPTVQT
jgi:hypothetical protein